MTLDDATNYFSELLCAMCKDVMSATATGALSGITMPIAAGALSALSAAVASNWGEQDLVQLPRFFRETMLQTYA